MGRNRTPYHTVRATLIPATLKTPQRIMITDKEGHRKNLRRASPHEVRLLAGDGRYFRARWLDGEWRLGGKITNHRGKPLTW